MRRRFYSGANGESLMGPVLLLVLIVALPTAAMLWLTREASENERLAVRQRLTDAYRSQLEMVCRQVAADWRRSLEELDAAVDGRTGSQAFAACVRQGLADGAIVLDADGKPIYPAAAVQPADDGAERDPAWLAAKSLEFVDRNYVAAAAAYESLAKTTADANLAGRAVQAQVRALFTAGQDAAAVGVLETAIADPRLRDAVDSDGRSIFVDLALRLVEKTMSANPTLAQKTATQLAARLEDYDSPGLASAQRRFAMTELRRLRPDVALPTLPAEELSADQLERLANGAPGDVLRPAGGNEVWTVAAPQRRVVALFRAATVRARLQKEAERQTLPTGVRVAVVEPNETARKDDEFLSTEIGPSLSVWHLSLSFDEDPFAEAAAQRGRFYLWTAVVTIIATMALAGLTAFALRRQMRLARMKNDLAAVVSHELKTPLAAIRLLVDTLSDEAHPDPQRTREYLQLIARENERLTRLVDNFLTFSRMERGQAQFARATVDPAEVARRAIDAMAERLHDPSCVFESRIEPELPTVTGDDDGLVTVLLNLLDNAWKYTGPQKRIALAVYSRDAQVCFAVEDDGVGLSARHRRRVFERFFQVDRQLTRTAGGCGLGLSIVRNIVAAHGGTIDVDSELGRGSTFTVRIPAGVINHRGTEDTEFRTNSMRPQISQIPQT